jgi:hypothetical protein
VIQITHSVLSRIGIKLDNSQSGGTSKNEPVLEFLDTQKMLEPLYAPICVPLGL